MPMHPTASVPRRGRTGRSRIASRAAAPLVALTATLALARPVPMPAQPAPPECPPPECAPTEVIAQQGGVSLEQAQRLATQRYPGRVVRAETTVRNGRRVHEIRILVEGDGDSRMRIVRIDAESGRFL